VYITNSTN